MPTKTPTTTTEHTTKCSTFFLMHSNKLNRFNLGLGSEFSEFSEKSALFHVTSIESTVHDKNEFIYSERPLDRSRFDSLHVNACTIIMDGGITLIVGH